MLEKWPIPNTLSEVVASARGLWIRRVLVRAQEEQLEGAASDSPVRRLPLFATVRVTKPSGIGTC